MDKSTSPLPWRFENLWNGVIAIYSADGAVVATLAKHATNKEGVPATAHAVLQNANAQMIVDLVNRAGESAK